MVEELVWSVVNYLARTCPRCGAFLGIDVKPDIFNL